MGTMTHPIASDNKELIIISQRRLSSVRAADNKLLHAAVSQRARDGQDAIDTIIHDESAGIRDAFCFLGVRALMVIGEPDGFSATAVTTGVGKLRSENTSLLVIYQ